MKIAAALLAATLSAQAASLDAAAQAVNQLGIDLHRKLPAAGNVCISPYSIQSALAMTYAGADGATRAEMEHVLHYKKNGAKIHDSFAALRSDLDDAVKKSAKRASDSKKWGGPSEPIVLNVANRLFGQSGYDFSKSFTTLVKAKYGAPMALMDFKTNSAGATREINEWISTETKKRIQNLIPQGALDRETRLVLTNALYFKAPWSSEFSESLTKAEVFHISDDRMVKVPTMIDQSNFRYMKAADFSAVAIPYSGGDLQFIVLVPDELDGIRKVESKLTAEALAACAKAEPRDIILHLPKFKIEPPAMPLGDHLQALGMKTAFDKPAGSADFSGIAPRKPDDYLFISQVFHKTFIALDEKGTEAAAATAVIVARAVSEPMEKPKPLEVRADRPFLFAIQHIPSGACLFLGRVTDPR